MDTIRFSFILQLEAFLYKYAYTLAFVSILMLSLLTFAVMKGVVHFSHPLFLANGGSTPPPDNSGGGGPWS